MLATTLRLSSRITHRDIVKFHHTFLGAVFTMRTNERHHSGSIANAIQCLYFQCLTSTFFRKLTSATTTINLTIDKIKQRFLKSYPWAVGAGRDLPNAYALPKRKKQFTSGRPIVSFFTSPFRPMLNCIANNSFQQRIPHMSYLKTPPAASPSTSCNKLSCTQKAFIVHNVCVVCL
jgi:hypothetical protein